MGIAVDQVWFMTMREINAAISGYYRRANQEYKNIWESSRFIAFWAVKPYAKKGKMRSVTELVRFPWEKSSESLIEEKRARVQSLLKRMPMTPAPSRKMTPAEHVQVEDLINKIALRNG